MPGVPGMDAPSLDELTTRFRVSDRDVGVMAHGAPEGTGLAYWVGAFNGRGATDNEDLNGAKQVVGRVQYTFRPDDGLPVSLAAAAASLAGPAATPNPRRAANLNVPGRILDRRRAVKKAPQARPERPRGAIGVVAAR